MTIKMKKSELKIRSKLFHPSNPGTVYFVPKGTKKGPYDCPECGVDISITNHSNCSWAKIKHG